MAIQEISKTIHGYKKYKAAINLSENDLKALESILKEYCDNISYEVTQKGNKTKNCNAVHEVTIGDNFLENRVVALQIHCYQDKDEIISFFIGRYLSPTVFGGVKYGFFCKYVLPEQVAHKFTQAIKHFLQGIREPYSPFTRLSFKNLLYIVSPFAVIGLIAEQLSAFDLDSLASIKASRAFFTAIQQRNIFAYYCATIGVVFLLITLLLLDVFIINPAFLRILFPPITFAWGKEAEHHEVVKKRREHLLWGVIIALVVSIVAGVIAESLPK